MENEKTIQEKQERNIKYLEEIIKKYNLLKTFEKPLEKIKENPDTNKINDLLRIICSILDEKINTLNEELKTAQEKNKAIQEEFNIDEYEKLKKEKEELETQFKTQIEEYESKLKEYENKYSDLIDRYQKVSNAYIELKNEYESYINRMQKNQDKLKRESKERIISNLIPVIDSFNISLNSLQNTQNINDVLKGVELIYSQLIDVLKNEGLEIIKTEPGQNFDPSIHEAIEIEETDSPEKESIIIQEYRPAYKLMDKILRPASVKVYKLKNKIEGDKDG